MSSAVDLAYERNEIVMGDDGYYHYWPSQDTVGAFSEYALRSIADELERLNRDYDEEIKRFFNQEKPNGKDITL